MYPAQTQFDVYLRSRGIIPEHFYDQRSNPLAKKLGIFQTNKADKVDFLRLSHNVRRNMKREEESGEEYGDGVDKGKQKMGMAVGDTIEEGEGAAEDDISLQNRNTVLNFGEKDEE